MKFQKSFSEYYGENDYINKTENETISGSGKYYIHDAVFSFHYQNRAIYLDSNNKVLIETCSFYNNSCKEEGGSFYIKKSDCVLVHICCLFSSSESGGCAYEIHSPDDSTHKNYAFECSVSQCSGVACAFYHYLGDIKVSNMNTSYHYEITEYAAYAIDHPRGAVIIINLTTASNSSSSFQSVISHYEGNYNITKCNYLNNECQGGEFSTDAIIRCYGSCTFSNCSFIGNKGNYLFSEKPTIDNCYFKAPVLHDYCI